MTQEKFVIFRRNGVLYLTSKENYERVIWDASLLTKLENFKSFDEVADYLWSWKRIGRNCLIDMTDKNDW